MQDSAGNDEEQVGTKGNLIPRDKKGEERSLEWLSRLFCHLL